MRVIGQTFCMLAGNIRVYCRVRPFLGGQPSQNSVVSSIEEGSMSLMIPPNSKLGKEGKKMFNFNKVFGSSSTQGWFYYIHFH